jgi:hypothetical membrane protein
MNRHVAWVAPALWLTALLGFGAMVEGYSHVVHPVALLGARGMPQALAFNLVGLVAPGLLAAWAAYSLRQRLPDGAGWSARIGAWMLLVSALAFAAQGLLPLDPSDLDATGSRLHAVAWMLWWIAFVPAALLLAIGMLGMRGRRAVGRCSAADRVRRVVRVAGAGHSLGAFRSSRQPASARIAASSAPSLRSSIRPKCWRRSCPLRSISTSVGVPCMP